MYFLKEINNHNNTYYRKRERDHNYLQSLEVTLSIAQNSLIILECRLTKRVREDRLSNRTVKGMSIILRNLLTRLHCNYIGYSIGGVNRT